LIKSRWQLYSLWWFGDSLFEFYCFWRVSKWVIIWRSKHKRWILNNNEVKIGIWDAECFEISVLQRELGSLKKWSLETKGIIDSESNTFSYFSPDLTAGTKNSCSRCRSNIKTGIINAFWRKIYCWKKFHSIRHWWYLLHTNIYQKNISKMGFYLVFQLKLGSMDFLNMEWELKSEVLIILSRFLNPNMSHYLTIWFLIRIKWIYSPLFFLLLKHLKIS
jgi:hypothetical protein